MKFSVIPVLLATCLVAQAEIFKSPAITLLDYYEQNNNTPESRIISGQPARRGEFPFQAAIWINTPKGAKGFCGGTLISSRWVLTAAHCVKGFASWDIKLGGIRIDQNEPGSITLHSTTAIVHRGYNSLFVKNDVALIKLPRDVSFSQFIQPLRLPRRSDRSVGVGVRARVSGFGKTRDSSTTVSPYLSFVDVDTISNFKCSLTYGLLTVNKGSLCATGRPQHSPCNGDSGGPLTITEPDGQRTHAGVVSFVHRSGCASRNPSGYARTTTFLNWIHQNTGIPIRP